MCRLWGHLRGIGGSASFRLVSLRDGDGVAVRHDELIDELATFEQFKAQPDFAGGCVDQAGDVLLCERGTFVLSCMRIAFSLPRLEKDGRIVLSCLIVCPCGKLGK